MKLTEIFANRKFLFVFLLGFSSGLPISLIGGTLQAWMSQAEVNIKTIGAFALVGYPYTFKFLWSPLMVRFVPPFLGPRRGWMVVCQLILMCLFVAMANTDPGTQLAQLAILAVGVAFFSASQDIVIDAYRTELLEKDEVGTGASLAIFGYRLAMIVSGAIALILAAHYSWREVYCLMALLLLIGVIATYFAPEPGGEIPTPKNLSEAVLQPLKEYFRRKAAVEILLFVVLYKLGDVLALALQTKFLLSLDFTTADIGYVAKGVGLVATIVGSLTGGPLMDRLGMRRALVLFGFFQGVSILSFMVLSEVGHNFSVMACTIAFENFCSGLGNAAFIGYLMTLCNKRYSATQYALLTSLGAIPRVFSASSTGYLVSYLGWSRFFVFCTAAAIPGLLLLLWRFDRWADEEAN